MAPEGLPSPRVVWAEIQRQEKHTGKNILQRATAGIMKGGREFVRAPPRLGSLRRRGDMADADSRPASRLSMFMDRFNVGDGEQGRETPRRASVDHLRDMDQGLQPAEGVSRRSTSALKDVLSFRNPYKHQRRASNMSISSPIIHQTDESISAIDSMRIECEDTFDCRAPS